MNHLFCRGGRQVFIKNNAVFFIKTFDTAKMETVKIEDTRKLAAAIRALAYAAQENLPEGSEFSPYLDKY